MSRRDRVVSATTPRMAATQAAKPQPAPAQKPVRLERLQKIDGTGRLEAAPSAGSGQKRQDRRERQLITANKKTQEENHQGARIGARFLQRNRSSFALGALGRYESGAAARRIEASAASRNHSSFKSP